MRVTPFRLLLAAAPLAGALFLVLGRPEALRNLARDEASRTLVHVLQVATWVAPGLVGIAAWQHGRSRISLACLTLGLVSWSLADAGRGLEAAGLPGLVLGLVASAGLAAAIPLEDEQRVLSASGLVRLAAFVGALGSATWALEEKASWVEALVGRLGLATEVVLAAPLCAATLGLTVLAAVLALRRRRPGEEIELALFVALVCLLLGLVAEAGSVRALAVPLAGTVFFGGGCLSLAQALHVVALQRGTIDPLTGLPNRRALDARLARLGGKYCIAVADVDHFKRVNDRHGHEAGDVVLQALAEHLRSFEPGLFYRSGGEEFVALVTGLDLEELGGELNSLREAISAETIEEFPELPGKPSKKARSLRITVSLGAAQRSDRNPSPRKVLAAADAALLRAKKRGRNRLEVEKRARTDRQRRRAKKSGA